MTSESCKAAVLTLVAREVGAEVESLSLETRLEALGIDSLEFLCLMLCVNKEIGTLPETRYHALNTIGDIVKELQP